VWLIHHHHQPWAQRFFQTSPRDDGIKRPRRGRCVAPSHPRTRNVFFVITFFAGYLCGRNAGTRISPAWGSRRWLSFLVRSRTSVQIHFRGLCHWAGELTARQAAEPPSRRPTSRRARERQETEPASSTPSTRAVLNARSEMSWPCAAVFHLSSPLVAHSAHALPFVQWRQPPPVSWTQAQSPD